MLWIWATILTTSLIAIYAMSRAGTIVFWKSSELGQAGPSGDFRERGDEHTPNLAHAPANWLAVAAVVLLLSGIVALTAFAGPVMRFAEATAAQLHNPDAYVSAVLEGQEGTK